MGENVRWWVWGAGLCAVALAVTWHVVTLAQGLRALTPGHDGCSLALDRHIVVAQHGVWQQFSALAGGRPER